MKGRHVSNFQGVIDAIDAYCETQEEFDDWMIWINTCIDNYSRMVQAIVVDSEPSMFDKFGGGKYK